MSNIIGSRSNVQQGMSFEGRTPPEEEDEIMVDRGGFTSGSEGGGSGSVFRDHDPLLSSSNDMFITTPSYKKVHTLWISLIMVLAVLGVFVASVVIPIQCAAPQTPINDTHTGGGGGSWMWISVVSGWVGAIRKEVCLMKPVSVLLYLHCILWGFSLIFDQIIRYQHARIRRRGYLEFYKQTYMTSQLPFWIVSAWSTLLLAVATILHDHCKSATQCAKSIHLTRAEYLTIFIGLEAFVLLVILSYYIFTIARFNRSKHPPDVFMEDMVSEIPRNAVGRIDEEVFQRQVDLIRYFRERNTVLQRTVLHLNSQIDAAHQTVPSATV